MLFSLPDNIPQANLNLNEILKGKDQIAVISVKGKIMIRSRKNIPVMMPS
jgi:hypothetical protein